MGFKYWQEAFIFVSIFSVLIIVPCYFIAFFGSKMLNEMGNFPSQSDFIQSKSLWKVLVVFILAMIGLVAFFQIFS